MGNSRVRPLSYPDPGVVAPRAVRGRRLFIFSVVLLTVSSLSDGACLAAAAAGHDLGFVLDWCVVGLLLALLLAIPAAIVAGVYVFLALARARPGEPKLLIAALIVLVFHGAATAQALRVAAAWLPGGVH